MDLESRIFAENLVNFVKIYYIFPKCVAFSSRSSRTILPMAGSVRAVLLHHLENSELEAQNIFNLLLEHENLNQCFEEFSKDMVKEVCVRRFNEKDLMQFCAVLSRLAVLSYNFNYRDCIQHAISAIVDVLNYFHITGELTSVIWRKLVRTSLFA